MANERGEGRIQVMEEENPKDAGAAAATRHAIAAAKDSPTASTTCGFVATEAGGNHADQTARLGGNGGALPICSRCGAGWIMRVSYFLGKFNYPLPPAPAPCFPPVSSQFII